MKIKSLIRMKLLLFYCGAFSKVPLYIVKKLIALITFNRMFFVIKAQVIINGLPTYYPFTGLNAYLSSTPLQGKAPLNVQFTDESKINPTVWIWDFHNDGINDAFIQNPSFTFEVEGNYSLKLIVY